MADISLKGVSKKFGSNTALRSLDLDIKDGEFFVLLGQTGAGKTTALRIIAGLEKPDEGEVYIASENVAGWNAAQRDVALVLQQYSLYPRLTVRGNLEFPLKAKIRRMDAEEIKRRVDEAAEILQITQLLDRKVERLSGGEMQRVSIGRAIVREPQVFLMDEPLSALDAKLRESLRVELKRLHSDLGATFLYVTHDQVEAMSMGDKIAVLNQGRIIQVGTPKEIYDSPCNTFVARSVGSPPMNLLNGSLNSKQAFLNDGKDSLPVSNSNIKVTGDMIFGVRPENLVLESGAPLEAKIFDVEDHGVNKILSMNLGETRLHAMVSAKTKVVLDETVRFGWKSDKVLMFDNKTGANLLRV
jgi:multiple sugar transport system ATP-binding protein